MKFSAPFLVLLLAAPWTSAQEKTRCDQLGDPLPAHAVARLGTLRLRHQGWLVAQVLSADGKRLAAADINGDLWIWDASTGKKITRLKVDVVARVLAFSPTATTFAAGTVNPAGNNLYLWQTHTGKLLHQLAGHKGKVVAVQFLDGGKTLASAGADGFVRWWDTATGKLDREMDILAAERKHSNKDKSPALYSAAFNTDVSLLVGPLAEMEDKGFFIITRPRTLKAWELRKGKSLWELSDKEVHTASYGLSADGKVLAILAGEAEVSVRDGWTGKEKLRVRERHEPGELPDNYPSSVVVSPDGKVLAVMGQGPAGIQLWETFTGKPRHQLGRWIIHGVSSDPPQACFSADGKTLAFPWANTFVLWEAATGKELLRPPGHRESVHHLHFSPDGNRLVSGNKGNWPPWRGPKEAITWDTGSWKELARAENLNGYHFEGTIYTSIDQRLSFVHNGKGGLFIRERRSGNMLCKLEVESKDGFSTSGFFSASGKLVCHPVGSKLYVMDTQSGKELASLPRDVMEYWFAIAPNDKRLAWYDETGRVHVNEVNGGKALWTLGEASKGWDGRNPRPTLAFSPDARYLASWRGDHNVILVYDLKTGAEFRRFPGRNNLLLDASRWICMTYSPDGRTLAVGGFHGENDVLLFNLDKGTLERCLPGHLGRVRSLAFSPDGRLLASGSSDTTVLIWEVPKK
jgi:WD40 repeat protein